MKIIPASLLTMLMLGSPLFAQKEEEKPPTEADLYKHFSVGTIFGNNSSTTNLTSQFGKLHGSPRNPFFKGKNAGRYIPNEFYEYEVGEDFEDLIAWVKVVKIGLKKPLSIGQQEILPLLNNVAGGGTWTQQFKREAKEEDKKRGQKEEYPNFEGQLWEYVRDLKGVNFRLYAYIPPSNREVLIFTPKVRAPLNGTSKVTAVSVAFNDGTEIPLIVGEEGSPVEIAYIDSPAPPEIIAANTAQDFASLNSKLSDALVQSMDNKTQILLGRNDYLALKDSRAILNLTSTGLDIEALKTGYPVGSDKIREILKTSNIPREEFLKNIRKIETDLTKDRPIPFGQQMK